MYRSPGLKWAFKVVVGSAGSHAHGRCVILQGGRLVILTFGVIFFRPRLTVILMIDGIFYRLSTVAFLLVFDEWVGMSYLHFTGLPPDGLIVRACLWCRLASTLMIRYLYGTHRLQLCRLEVGPSRGCFLFSPFD